MIGYKEREGLINLLEVGQYLERYREDRRTNRGYTSNKSVFDTFSDGQINSILETKTGEVSAAGGGVTVTKDLKEQLTGYVKQQDGDKKKRWRLNNVFVKLNEFR